MKIIRMLVIVGSILLFAIMTAISFQMNSEFVEYLTFTLLVLKNIAIVLIYVCSIRKLKSVIRGFNQKMPKEKAIICYCYILGIMILLKMGLIFDLLKHSNVPYIKSEIGISAMEVFAYCHYSLLFIIYKFLTE